MDISLDIIRARALAIASEVYYLNLPPGVFQPTWLDLTQQTDQSRQWFWTTIRLLCKEVDIPFEVISSYTEDTYFTWTASTGSFEPATLTPFGRGTITFEFIRGKTILHHIAPFENGLIYDPFEDDVIRNTGLTLDQYIKYHQNQDVQVRVLKIASLPEKGVK